MGKVKEGDRVGAIESSSDEVVRLFGYGTYLGEKEPPFNPLGIPKEEYIKLWQEVGSEDTTFTNPCIKLDNGDIVWGMECWWASEEEVKEIIGNRKVEIVSKGA